MKRFLTVCLLITPGLPSLWAQEKSNLIENSPFLPFDFKEDKGPAAPSASGSVEFRGVIDLGDGPQFSLFDAKAKKSYWIRENDPKAPYKVDRYDSQTQTIDLLLNGVRKSLSIKKASDSPVNIDSSTPSVPGLPATIGETAPANRPSAAALGSESSSTDPEKRQEMANKVFGAFKKYVEQRKAAAEAARNR